MYLITYAWNIYQLVKTLNQRQIHRYSKKIAGSRTEVIVLADILQLAGNEVRLKILLLLQREDELCVGDLCKILSMQPPAISQHLRKLKDGRLIKPQRNAQTIFYSLSDHGSEVLTPILSSLDEDYSALRRRR